MKIWREVLRKYRTALILFAAMTAGNAIVFTLYGIMAEPLVYAALLALVLLCALLLADYALEKRRSAERSRILKGILSDWSSLPEPDSLAEEYYQRMVTALGEQMEKQSAASLSERQDLLDYYTAWVHQIKTPIAVMRLKLSEDTPEHRALGAELGRIEQYAEMALQYIRIGCETNDLVIRECRLDDLIRAAVRKHAPQFVEKRLQLDFTPTNAVVITDEKRFSCILDQLLSNAVKYTAKGAVRIRMQEGLLKISDTGVGIAQEDLPRIFEKGFTGINGRLGQNSSGLGLYLAKKAADLLSIPLAVESAVGSGSTFIMDLRQKTE